MPSGFGSRIGDMDGGQKLWMINNHLLTFGKGAFTNYICIFWHLTTYVPLPSLHFVCSKFRIFLTTYPPLDANVKTNPKMICEGSLKVS